MSSAPPALALRAVDASGQVVCLCGCGRPTPPATRNDRARGVRKGQPGRYLRGHQPNRLARCPVAPSGVVPPPEMPAPPAPPPRAEAEPFPVAAPERPAGPHAATALWDACLVGREPAEVLDRHDRQNLVVLLFDEGWSLAEVARHTRETQSVIVRIAREALGYVPGAC